MKPDDQKLLVQATIEGSNPRRPRRIALEPVPGGGPLPAMADGKYIPVNGALVPFEPQQRPDDGTKQVRISGDAYERLRALRLRGESASLALERLIYQAKSSQSLHATARTEGSGA
jgi:hypothetical protein